MSGPLGNARRCCAGRRPSRAWNGQSSLRLPRARLSRCPHPSRFARLASPKSVLGAQRACARMEEAARVASARDRRSRDGRARVPPATCVVARLIWVSMAAALGRWRRRSTSEQHPQRDTVAVSPRAAALIGWCGMRGIVTLAAALALTSGSERQRRVSRVGARASAVHHALGNSTRHGWCSCRAHVGTTRYVDDARATPWPHARLAEFAAASCTSRLHDGRAPVRCGASGSSSTEGERSS